MVAPLIKPLVAGASKVVRIKKSLQKARRGAGADSSILQRRKERMYTKEALHNRPKKRGGRLASEKREENVRRVRDVLPYKKALQRVGKGSSTKVIKKAKVFNRAIMTLGSTAYASGLQPVFALLVLLALSVEDTWWGWIDFFGVSIGMATIFWVITVLLGLYSMFITSFMMSKYLLHWKMIIVGGFCFCANFVPVLQIIPWSVVLICVTFWSEE